MDNKEIVPNSNELQNEASTPLTNSEIVEQSTPQVTNQVVETPLASPEVSSTPDMSSIFPSMEPQQQIEPPQVEANNINTPVQPNPEQTPVVEEVQTPITLNGKEEVVYEYKPKKEVGIIPFIIFFALVGAIIVFLPNIQEYITNYKNGRIAVNGPVNNPNNNQPETPVTDNSNEEKKDFYDVSKDTIISIDKLTLSNFSKTSKDNLYYLTFDIENKDNNPYTFNENIYLQMYEEKQVIANAKLESDATLNGASKRQMSLIIPEEAYVKTFQVAVKKLNESSYPEVNLTTNLKDQQELSCTLKQRTLLYTFLNDTLIGIDEEEVLESSSFADIDSYNNSLTRYQDKANNYNQIVGITSSITNNGNSFKFILKIDPSSITNQSSLTDKVYYNGNTSAKKIAFEMQARGYTCK